MCLSIEVNHPEMVLNKGSHQGHDWVVVHNGMQYRCGYVKVDSKHPWYGKNYEHIDANVHGGLTFSDHDVPCQGEGADDGFWVGFDCAHAYDAPDPSLSGTTFVPSDRAGIIRTQEYVEAECRRLCEQAAKATQCQYQED